jgi:hypothetical protein
VGLDAALPFPVIGDFVANHDVWHAMSFLN